MQASLLGAGSLDPELLRPLRGRPKVAQRYLALEGRRVLADLGLLLSSAPGLAPAGASITASASDSLDLAGGRRAVAAAPEWFGALRPSRPLGAAPLPAGQSPTDKDLQLKIKPPPVPEADEDGDEEEEGEESKILKLFQNPLSNSNALSNFLSKMLGMSRSPGQGNSSAGGEMPVSSVRRVDKVGPEARPLPIPLQFVDDDAPGPAGGIGGALYPEWDVHKSRYRPEWCRVIEFPLGPAPDVSAGGVERDEVLRRRLARLGLGPKVLRRRPDGDDLDVDALLDYAVDVAAGHFPPTPSISNGASWPATSASSSSSTPPGRPPRPTATAAPSTSTSAGRRQPWPSPSKSSATGSGSTGSGPGAVRPCICWPSSRSASVSAPADGRSSTSSSRPATPASGRPSATPVKC